MTFADDQIGQDARSRNSQGEGDSLGGRSFDVTRNITRAATGSHRATGWIHLLIATSITAKFMIFPVATDPLAEQLLEHCGEGWEVLGHHVKLWGFCQDGKRTRT